MRELTKRIAEFKNIYGTELLDDSSIHISTNTLNHINDSIDMCLVQEDGAYYLTDDCMITSEFFLLGEEFTDVDLFLTSLTDDKIIKHHTELGENTYSNNNEEVLFKVDSIENIESDINLFADVIRNTLLNKFKNRYVSN